MKSNRDQLGIISGLLWLALVMVALPAAAQTEGVRALATELMCYCGCDNMVVVNCQCGTADAIRKEIADLLNAGQSREMILATFVERYGEKILSVPPKRGFNWAAWTMPFVALVLGLTLAGRLVWKWSGQKRKRRQPAVVDPRYLAQVQKELTDRKDEG